MLKHQKEILDAILSAIREQYANDIALMIVYGSAVNGTADENSDLDVFYIPKTEKGCHLAKTFLWDGVGYDIWCGSWSILHSMLIWEDMRVSILADSELVYSASDAEREKYEVMRRNAAERKNLPVSAHDYHPALAFVSKAKHYFGEACIGNSAAFGGVLMELVNAVCYVNRRYLKYGTKKIAEEISAYRCLPEDFLENYRSAVREPEKAVEICKKLILATEEFVHTQFAQFTGKNNTFFSTAFSFLGISTILSFVNAYAFKFSLLTDTKLAATPIILIVLASLTVTSFIIINFMSNKKRINKQHTVQKIKMKQYIRKCGTTNRHKRNDC